MARSRNIKHSFFQDAELLELPFEDRLLFAGLWTLADREGRLKDKPKQIKIEIFPADQVDVNESLERLSSKGMIIRYCVDGKRFIQICNFRKHQKPHHKEVDSEIPAPEKANVNNDSRMDESSMTHAWIKHDHEQAKDNASCPTDSFNLIPDTGFLIPDSVEKTCAPVEESPAAPPEDVNSPDQEFNDEFWPAYPNKKSKATALKAFRRFRKKKPARKNLDSILADLESRRRTPDWTKQNGQFIPMASTYLNQERWDDPLTSNVHPIQGTAASRHVGLDKIDFTEGAIDNGNGTYGF